MASDDQDSSVELLREANRLSEVRLAAQLQTRLAFEARLGSSPAFLLALVVGILTLTREEPSLSALNILNTGPSTLIYLAFFLSLAGAFARAKWHYPGTPPSFLVTHITCNKKYYRFYKLRHFRDNLCIVFLKKLRKEPFYYDVKSSVVIKDSKFGNEANLHRLSLYYEKVIAENNDNLNFIRFLTILPSFLVFASFTWWMAFYHNR